MKSLILSKYQRWNSPTFKVLRNASVESAISTTEILHLVPLLHQAGVHLDEHGQHGLA